MRCLDYRGRTLDVDVLVQCVGAGVLAQSVSVSLSVPVQRVDAGVPAQCMPVILTCSWARASHQVAGLACGHQYHGKSLCVLPFCEEEEEVEVEVEAIADKTEIKEEEENSFAVSLAPVRKI